MSGLGCLCMCVTAQDLLTTEHMTQLLMCPNTCMLCVCVCVCVCVTAQDLLSTEDMSQLLWGYASWGFYDASLLDMVTEKLTRRVKHLTNEQLSRVRTHTHTHTHTHTWAPSLLVLVRIWGLHTVHAGYCFGLVYHKSVHVFFVCRSCGLWPL